MVCVLQNNLGANRYELYFYDAAIHKFYGCIIYQPIYPLNIENVYLHEIGGDDKKRTSIFVEKLDEKYKVYKAYIDLKDLRNIVDEIIYDKI